MTALSKIKANSFAAACYDQNSIAELKDAIGKEADITDCETWALSVDEYHAEIKLALDAKLETQQEQLSTGEEDE